MRERRSSSEIGSRYGLTFFQVSGSGESLGEDGATFIFHASVCSLPRYHGTQSLFRLPAGRVSPRPSLSFPFLCAGRRKIKSNASSPRLAAKKSEKTRADKIGGGGQRAQEGERGRPVN